MDYLRELAHPVCVYFAALLVKAGVRNDRKDILTIYRN